MTTSFKQSAQALLACLVLAAAAAQAQAPAKGAARAATRLSDDEASWAYCQLTIGRNVRGQRDASVTTWYWPEQPVRTDELPQDWAAIWKSYVAAQIQGQGLRPYGRYWLDEYQEECQVFGKAWPRGSKSARDALAEQLESYRRAPTQQEMAYKHTWERKLLPRDWLKTPVTADARRASEAAHYCVVHGSGGKTMTRQLAESNVYEAQLLRVAFTNAWRQQVDPQGICDPVVAGRDGSARETAQARIDMWVRESRGNEKMVDFQFPRAVAAVPAAPAPSAKAAPALTIDDSYAKSQEKFRKEHEQRMKAGIKRDEEAKAKSAAATAAAKAQTDREIAERAAKAKPCDKPGCASKQ